MPKNLMDYRMAAKWLTLASTPSGLAWKDSNIPAGRLRKGMRWKVVVGGIPFMAHSLVWFLTYGKISTQIDHIDGNPSNNRLENLRAATHSENMCNSKRPKHNTSGVKGVSWNSRSCEWYAAIQLNGKSHWVGCFSNLKDAEAAVRVARTKLHGTFTNHGINKGA